jgi:hypothetical protein
MPREANTLSPAIPFVGKHVVSPRFVSDPAATLLERKVVLRESWTQIWFKIRQGGKLLSSGLLNGGCDPESSGDSGNPRPVRLRATNPCFFLPPGRVIDDANAEFPQGGVEFACS